MSDRLISISGILFVLLTMPGFVFMAEGIPGGNDVALEEAAAWLEDGSNRVATIVGMYLMLGGGLAFLVFASGLTNRLVRCGADRTLTEIARGAGLAAALLILISAALIASPAIQVWAGGEPRPVTGDTVRLASLGQNLLLTAGWAAAALFVASMSLAALRSGVFPRWLGLVGMLVAPLLLLGILFIPALGIFPWAVCVSAVVWVRPVAPAKTPGSAAAAQLAAEA